MRSIILLAVLGLLPFASAAPTFECKLDNEPLTCGVFADTPAGQAATATAQVDREGPTGAALTIDEPGTGRSKAKANATRIAGGNYTLNVDARDNGITATVDDEGPVAVGTTLDEQAVGFVGGLRCEPTGATPRCFPTWASLVQIPAGIVFTKGDERGGASAGVILFAQGAVVGCFLSVPAPDSGQPTLACFP